ncbi:MAG TPA: cyclase family protein [Gammaproteobacteria bacterium]|jgi:kynurenine formamidase|nr:cyclase family protein [Gammaproteobacteria bacterium]
MSSFTRRDFVASAGLVAAALSRPAAAQQTPQGSGQDRSRAPRATRRAKDLTDDELEAMFHRCSNTGRWGADDELGTLNYVTAAKRIAAASLVKTGEVVSIGRDISKTASKVDPHPVQLLVTYNGGSPGISDYVTMAPHGMTITHLDALSHFMFDDMLYNGRKRSATMTADGAKWGSIYALRQGVFTRGVLLDVAAARGVPWYESDEYVTVADFEAAEKRQNVRVSSGDALLVRTGMERMEQERGLQDTYPRAGFHAECAEWMHQREVAIYGGDCIEKLPYPSERFPSAMHMIALASMGLPILDWPALTVLAQTCDRHKRWDFLLTTAPMRLPGGTSAPVNPLCLF